MKKLTKLVSGFVVFAMALSFVVTPVTASAATAEELQAQITSLMATINALQAQLNTTSGSTVSTGYTFNTNLTVGSKGADVMNLQKVLNMSADTTVALTGAGSKGMETTTFGPATKAAVIKFQTKYGITPAAGYVGAITRAKLNSMGGTTTTPTTGTYPAGCTSSTGYSSTTGQACSGGTTTTLPTGGNLTVTAGTQPTNSLAPQSAARLPFTTVVLTAGSADVTVNSITVERSGLAQDAVFAGVVLLDQNGLQIGIAKTLNSNHQAMVGEPFVVKAGTSKTVTVAGNMATDLRSYAGQVAGLNVVAVNTSATVAGSMPILGAQQTVNATLTLGSADVIKSSFDPNGAQTKEIGTTGYKFSGVRVTAGSAEKVKLWSIRWNQSGSASSNDLANVMVYVDGTAYPTTVSTDGKYYSALFTGGLLIDKGMSKDIYIQGDIVGTGAAGRTIRFDLYKTTDLYVSGDTYMYGITPTATAGNGFGTTPWYTGSVVTVSAGSITAVQKAVSVPAQNIAVNVPNQVLGGFDTDMKGEAISVQSMVFNIASTTGSGYGLLTNVSLVDSNGAIVAGPVDATYVDSTNQKVTFTDTVTFPIGKKTYTLKGKVPSTIGNGGTYVVTTNPFSNWSNVTGQTTGNSITLPNTTATLNTMTVKSAALAVTIATTPTAQIVVAGSQNKLLANYQFDASQSGEDVRFSSVQLTLAGTVTNLTSCQLFDGATALNTGSNVVNPSSATPTFSFDSTFTVPKGTIKTLSMKCNVSSGATGTNQWGITTSSTNPSVTGVTSGATVTVAAATLTAPVMTMGTVGTLVVSNSAGSTANNYKMVAAGTTGNEIGAFKFTTTNEGVNLSRIALKLTNTASSSASDLNQVSIWANGAQIGTVTFTGSARTGTSTAFTLPLPIGDTEIKIKADFASIGTNMPGVQGDLIAVDINNADTTGTQGTGVDSGSTVNATGSTSVGGARLFKSFPTFALDTLGTSGVADGKLMRFKVTANPTGSIGLNQFKFTLATTSIAVTNVNLYAYSKSDYTGAAVTSSGQLSAANVAPGVGGAITITPSTIVSIAAGDTMYFELRGSTAASQTTYSVTTTLLGDSSYPSLSTNMGISSDVAGGSLVWSPNATTTSNASHVDWTNGFNVSGLPSSGLIQNRSN